MLRTNQPFLNYLEILFHNQEHKGNIILESFEKDEKLLTQNEIADKIMLIKSGITKCFFTEKNNEEYIVEFLGKGEILGEIEMMKNVPCICSIEAITEVTVFTITIPYFQSLIKSDLNLNNLLLDVFAERIVNTSNRSSYQQLHATEHTLSQLLDLKAKEMKISKEDMASYLGTTVKSLTKAINNHEKKKTL